MNIKRKLVRTCSKVIPYKVAIRAARFFLATQGIGWATDVRDSGEAPAARAVITAPKPVIFDVGGNIGEFSQAMRDLVSEADIYIFEPSVAHFEKLQRRFHEVRNIRLIRAALSNEAGTMTLRKEAVISGLATLLERDLGYLGIDQSILETVDVITGDSFMERCGIPEIHYLKIDVEGWEMPVLQGFDKHLSAGKIHACQFEFTNAQIERRENFRDFYRFFTKRGYVLHSIKPDGSLRKIDQYEEILDCYFASNYLAILGS